VRFSFCLGGMARLIGQLMLGVNAVLLGFNLV